MYVYGSSKPDLRSHSAGSNKPPVPPSTSSTLSKAQIRKQMREIHLANRYSQEKRQKPNTPPQLIPKDPVWDVPIPQQPLSMPPQPLLSVNPYITSAVTNYQHQPLVPFNQFENMGNFPMENNPEPFLSSVSQQLVQQQQKLQEQIQQQQKILEEQQKALAIIQKSSIQSQDRDFFPRSSYDAGSSSRYRVDNDYDMYEERKPNSAVSGFLDFNDTSRLKKFYEKNIQNALHDEDDNEHDNSRVGEQILRDPAVKKEPQSPTSSLFLRRHEIAQEEERVQPSSSRSNYYDDPLPLIPRNPTALSTVSARDEQDEWVRSDKRGYGEYSDIRNDRNQAYESYSNDNIAADGYSDDRHSNNEYSSRSSDGYSNAYANRGQSHNGYSNSRQPNDGYSDDRYSNYSMTIATSTGPRYNGIIFLYNLLYNHQQLINYNTVASCLGHHHHEQEIRTLLHIACLDPHMGVLGLCDLRQFQ